MSPLLSHPGVGSNRPFEVKTAPFNSFRAKVSDQIIWRCLHEMDVVSLTRQPGAGLNARAADTSGDWKTFCTRGSGAQRPETDFSRQAVRQRFHPFIGGTLLAERMAPAQFGSIRPIFAVKAVHRGHMQAHQARPARCIIRCSNCRIQFLPLLDHQRKRMGIFGDGAPQLIVRELRALHDDHPNANYAASATRSDSALRRLRSA